MEIQKNLISDFTSGLIDRRTFLKGLVAISGAVSLSGCLTYFHKETGLSSSINDLQLKNIHATQNHLLPPTPSNPSAEQINALAYLQFVLHDEQVEVEEKEFLIRGANLINESSQENFQLNFFLLAEVQKEQIFQIISKKNWGENWLSANLKYIFEAMLSDPIYGGNPKAIGWNWLGFQPGYPRPSELNAYPTILKV